MFKYYKTIAVTTLILCAGVLFFTSKIGFGRYAGGPTMLISWEYNKNCKVGINFLRNKWYTGVGCYINNFDKPCDYAIAFDKRSIYYQYPDKNNYLGVGIDNLYKF